MSDLELLFLILALLYLWECLAWLPRGSVAFKTWLGRHWQLAQPSASFGNQRGGFVLAPPLPPLGSFLTATPFPVSLALDGVLAAGSFIPFADLRDVRVKNKTVVLNGAVRVKCAYPNAARDVVETIDLLAKLPAAKRAEAIEHLVRGRFDVSLARKRWEGCHQISRWLRRLVNGLFLYLFIAVPLVITQVGFKRTWLELLIGLLGLTITEAVLFYRAHRVLYPPEEDDRFTHTLTIALSPATAMRAHDLLTRPLLQTFHPLVPARIFLDPAAFSGYAGHVLRDLRNPVRPKDAPPQPVETHWQAVLLRNLENFLKKNDADPETLLRPPAPADDTCRAYCPRCLTQFTNPEGTCADCGLPLVAFAGKSSK